MFVCSSTSATSSGCSDTQYCSASGTANLSCVFASETDSAAHNWYAFIYDDLGEAASSNPLSGVYVTDFTGPTIIIVSPLADSLVTQTSVSFSIVGTEPMSSGVFSLNESQNISMTNSSSYLFSYINSSVGDGNYSLIFYANDSYGNLGVSDLIYFSVNSSIPDNTSPVITIWSPVNGSYDLDGEVLLNISSNENLTWAGYQNNSGSLSNLGNVSMTGWNATTNFSEGMLAIVFYANDTSNNQGNASTTIYVDLNVPNVTSFNCDSSVNDSVNLSCNATFYDAIGLDYVILSYNFSGSFVNSSQIDLSGTTDDLNYSFLQGNYTPGNYAVQVYLYDLSGRVNGTTIDYVQVLDDTLPIINNVSYSPNTTDALDPDVNVTINTSITEDYSINSVEVYYKNSSDVSWTNVAMSNTTVLNYNITIEFGAGNWTFYINATDLRGNANVSQNYTLDVSNDISQNVTTNVSLIKSFTYVQRSSANELGYVILNTTSDTSLNYNITVLADSNILSRFNLNNTLNQTENYSASSGDILYIPLYVNLTSLTSGLYSYNISIVSEAGIELFERNVNVQVADGPYLSMSFEDYSSSLTRGQSNVDYSISVTNLGTQDASGVYLYFELPSGFSLHSGSLVRYIGSLPVGVYATNSLQVDVSSSVADSNILIYGYSNSSNADSVNASKNITIVDPLVITQTVSAPGSSGGGAGSGGGSVNVSYSRRIDLIRGMQNSFDVFVYGKYPNKTLENLKLELTGYPSQYIKISPSIIGSVGYGENKSFKVTLSAPSYKGYEEYALKAKISGLIVQGESEISYSETQNIKLVIQEISAEKTSEMLADAQKAISLMNNSGFNFNKMYEMLSLAQQKLNDGKNKEAYDLADQILSTKDLAFAVSERINRLKLSLADPSDSGDQTQDGITGRAIFASSAIQNLLDMAVSAFERGDYSLADERVRNAETLLALERKGNVFLFVYLYWPQIIFALIVLSLLIVVSYRIYARRSVSEKIEDRDSEEEKIKHLISDTQKKYFGGKISVGVYHSAMKLYTDNLAKIREQRLKLRSKRISILSGEKVAQELDKEKAQAEKEIVKAQSEFYKDKKISEGEYKTQFEILNERLAEIEDERLTTNLMHKKSVVVKNVVENKNHSSWLSKIFESRRERKEKELKAKIDKLLSEVGKK